MLQPVIVLSTGQQGVRSLELIRIYRKEEGLDGWNEFVDSWTICIVQRSRRKAGKAGRRFREHWLSFLKK